MRICPYCGSDQTELMGQDDGGGDFGDAVCDQYDCHSCGQSYEANCIEADDDFDYEPPLDDDPGFSGNPDLTEVQGF